MSFSKEEMDLLKSVINESNKIKANGSRPIKIRDIVPIRKWLDDEYYVGKSGLCLYDYWKKEMIDIFETHRGQYNEIIVSGSLGCLNENTRIATSEGLLSLQELSDFPSFEVNEKIKAPYDTIKVLTRHGKNDIQLVKDNGYSETKRVSFESGRVLEGTFNHKFLIIKNGKLEWIELGDLKEGQSLVCFSDIKPFGSYHLPYEESYLMGYLLFSPLNFVDCVESKNRLGSYINKDNLGKCCFKRVPSFIFRGDMVTVSMYLSGVLDFICSHNMSYDVNILRDVGDLLDLFGLNYKLSCNGVTFRSKESLSSAKRLLSLNKGTETNLEGKVDSLQSYDCKELSDHNGFLDKIVSIEDTSCYTRDLSISYEHSYSVGSFISKNTGKSTFALYCMLRKLYELSCYKNIPALFHMMPNTLLSFIYFSISKTQAEMTGYGQFRSMLEEIPYFNELFAYNTNLSSMTEFPENLYFLYGSSQAHSIGLNMIGAILDEANFFQNGAQNANKATDYSKISTMYSSIRNRASGRFTSYGRDESLCILVSSATTSNSFTESRVNKGLSDPHVKIINVRTWEVKPKGTYSDKSFYVFVGSDVLDPFIIENKEDIRQVLDSFNYKGTVSGNTIDSIISSLDIRFRDKFIKIPIDFKKRFEDDIIISLQDIAGYSVAPTGRLFSSHPIYNQACKDYLRHPFYKNEIVISTQDGMRVKDFLDKSYYPIRRDRKRYVHIDQSLANDSTGFASAFVSGYRNDDGILKPIVTVDVQLRVNPPKKPKRISVGKVRDFIFYMRDVWGLEIGKVTYDSFSSSESLQVLEENGVNCGYQSVDRTDEQYLLFVDMLYDGRIETYKYPTTERELFNLIHFRDKRKVDHPDGGCFTYDTKIMLPDGASVSIGDLEGKKNFTVYGYKGGEFVPVVAKKCFLTKVVRELVEIGFSNGEVVQSTEDHRYMLSNGLYREASNLRRGDHLMSMVGELTVDSIKFLSVEPTPVYDIEVPETSNFALGSGVIVHNSKDVMDAIVGAVYNAVTCDSLASVGSEDVTLVNELMNESSEEDSIFTLDDLIGDGLFEDF